MSTTPTASTTIDQLLSHRDWLAGLARAVVGDLHRAQDVEQETWRTAIESPPRAGSGRGWLATVLRSRARDAHRRESRHAGRQERGAKPEAVTSTEQLAERAETQRIVIDAVLALEEPYKSTVLLRYFEELSPAEIGTRMGVPASTVRTRLQRAHDQLRAALRTRYGTDRKWLAALIPVGWPQGGGAVSAAASSSVVPLAVGALVLLAAAALFVWQPWAGESAPATDPVTSASTDGAPRLSGRADPAEDPMGAEPPKPEEPDAAPPAEGEDAAKGPPVPSLEPRTIRAVVVDPQGAPLRKVTVQVVSVSSDKAHKPGTVLAEALTDAKGEVQLGPIPALTIARLWAHDDAHVAVTSAFKGFTLEDKPIRMRLEPAQRVAGTLVEPDGTAVAGARVILHASFPGSFEALAHGTTDEAGRFAFPHVPASMVGPKRTIEGMLEAAARGFTEAWMELDIERDYEDLRFEIARERRIRGRLVDEAGNPLAGIPIELPDSVGGQQSRKDGTFEIPRLPPRAVTVRFSSMQHVVTQVRVPFEGERMMDIGDVVLTKGVVLEGRVVDADGKPVADCHVAIDSTRVNQIVRQGPTGEDGTFRFTHLGDEEHVVHVFTGSGAQVEQKGAYAGKGPIEVVIAKGPHVLIHLVDDATGKPLQVKGIRIDLDDGDDTTEASRHEWAGTPKSSHRFQIERAGRYRMAIHVEGYAVHRSAAVEVTLKSGAQLTARLKRP